MKNAPHVALLLVEVSAVVLVAGGLALAWLCIRSLLSPRRPQPVDVRLRDLMEDR